MNCKKKEGKYKKIEIYFAFKGEVSYFFFVFFWLVDWSLLAFGSWQSRLRSRRHHSMKEKLAKLAELAELAEVALKRAKDYFTYI